MKGLRIISLILALGLLAGCAANTPAGTEPVRPGESTQSTQGGTPDSSDPEATQPGADQPADTTPGETTPGETTPAGSTPTVTDPATPTDPYEEPEPPAPDDGVIDIGYDRLPCAEDELYGQLFDPSNKIEIDLEMSDAELAKMQADYEKNHKSPVYRIADLTVSITSGGKTTVYRIHDVGVRMKGNTSRTDFYNSNDGIYKAIHLKLDFQETFDDETYYGSEARQWASEVARDERKDRTFATLEKLELRWNKCYDSTYLKEGYAYDLYREFGVLAPLTNLCSFDWSGIHMGVYSINEPVDKVFLEKRLPAKDLGGDLYKLGWTYAGASFTNTDSIGIEDEWNNEFYIYDLKTNKKTSTHESLKNLINRLNSGTVTEELFASLVDVDYFLNYAAVSYFLGNPDDLRHNYNNCYLYFLKSSGKAIIIPYDYDRCLGVTYEYNPSGNGLTTEDPFSQYRFGQYNDKQDNPLFIYSIDKGGYYVEEFAQVLKTVAADNLLKPATFKAKFDKAKSLYGNDVRPSKELGNVSWRNLSFSLDASDAGNLSFQDYITKKIATCNSYLAKLDEYLDYEPPVRKSHYIRGDFNGWSTHDEWAMTAEDGLFTITLSFDHAFSFKVYNDLTGAWYGTEYLPEGWELDYETDGHSNFDMPAGTYYVTFDPVDLVVKVTKV